MGGQGNQLNSGYDYKCIFIPENNNKSLSNNYVHTVFGDGSGIIWVGTENGLNKLSFNKFEESVETISHYFYNPHNLQGSSKNQVFAILKDHSDTYWIGPNDPRPAWSSTPSQSGWKRELHVPAQVPSRTDSGYQGTRGFHRRSRTHRWADCQRHRPSCRRSVGPGSHIRAASSPEGRTSGT